jgi:pilus assembly protein CpaB
MKGKLLIVVVALVLGGAAAFASYSYLSGVQRQAEAGSALTEVFVAVKDIPRGVAAEDLVPQGLVEAVSIPLRYVAEGAISSARSVAEKVLAVPVSKGEMLTAARFQYPNEAGLAFTVPKGFVAVTIPVDESRGMTGLLKPGDRVALLATIPTGGSQDNRTRIMLPGVRVLAVGSSTDAAPGAQASGSGSGIEQSGEAAPARTVTVAVSAADAEKLVFAVEVGRVWMALLPSTASSAEPGPGQSASTVLR